MLRMKLRSRWRSRTGQGPGRGVLPLPSSPGTFGHLRNVGRSSEAKQTKGRQDTMAKRIPLEETFPHAWSRAERYREAQELRNVEAKEAARGLERAAQVYACALPFHDAEKELEVLGAAALELEKANNRLALAQDRYADSLEALEYALVSHRV